MIVRQRHRGAALPLVPLLAVVPAAGQRHRHRARAEQLGAHPPDEGDHARQDAHPHDHDHERSEHLRAHRRARRERHRRGTLREQGSARAHLERLDGVEEEGQARIILNIGVILQIITRY